MYIHMYIVERHLSLIIAKEFSKMLYAFFLLLNGAALISCSEVLHSRRESGENIVKWKYIHE